VKIGQNWFYKNVGRELNKPGNDKSYVIFKSMWNHKETIKRSSLMKFREKVPL